MTNFERTRAEKIFFGIERAVHNTFYHHPVLRDGALGWVLRQLGSPLRLYRHKIWNRFGFNKDGRITTETALRTVIPTILVLIVVAWAIFKAI